jgi:hypothetical protein
VTDGSMNYHKQPAALFIATMMIHSSTGGSVTSVRASVNL